MVRLLVGVVVVYLVVAGLATVFQRQLIHLPDTAPPAAPPDIEEVRLETADELELVGWFLAHDRPVSTVLVTPGNAGNRALRLPLARGLAARGHAVLLLEHRGYGGNPGSPSEAGLAADALAAREHLENRSDVAADRIVHLGESLGSAVAVGLSADREPLAVVLRSPFPALVDVARRQLPFLPVGLLLRDRFATLDHLGDVAAPVLVVAGERDGTVPLELSRAVASTAGAELLVVEEADHNDRALLDGDRYLDAVDAFIRSHLGPGS
ncbi:MAG: alpha/beta hydrolase [Nitriliruptor sp.]|uniref:alpha/beta hydrolase n=1 Tax=Nitriliruptor sp. TaxID=2448056 RepID=UPI0034A0498C